jgi:hypothetical protein
MAKDLYKGSTYTIEEVFAKFQCPYKVGVSLKELLNDWNTKRRRVRK